MAELELLPALHNADTRYTTVVANGFSCRQQIRQHSQHQPRHLAELMLAYIEANA